MEISSPHTIPLAKDSASQAMSPEERQKLRQACADFEALLNQQMLGAMREASFEPEGLFEKSYGEKMFQSMADQELATIMARNGGTGFGDMLFEQLTPKR